MLKLFGPKPNFSPAEPSVEPQTDKPLEAKVETLDQPPPNPEAEGLQPRTVEFNGEVYEIPQQLSELPADDRAFYEAILDATGNSSVAPLDLPTDKSADKKADKSEEKAADKKAYADPMIPKARLDEVLKKAQIAEQRAAYFQGLAEARAQGQQPSAMTAAEMDGPQVAAKDSGTRTVEQIDEDILTLSRFYDAGEISLEELERKRLALYDERHALRSIAQAPQQNAELEKILLDGAVGQVRENYPVMARLFSEEAEHDPLAAARKESLSKEALAQIMQENDSRVVGSQFLLQLAMMERMGQISAQYQSIWYPDLEQPAHIKTASPEQFLAKPLSDKAQARADKLVLSQQQPPNIHNLGSHAGIGEITDEQFMALSEDEQADLLSRNQLLKKRLTGN